MRLFTPSIALFLGILLSTSGTFAQQIDAEYKVSQTHFTMPATAKPGDYMEKTVIIKIKPQYRAVCLSDKINHPLFNQLYTSIGGKELQKKFPHTKAPERLMNGRGETLTDLTLIYEFSYTSDAALEKVISKFIALQLFEYAEPHYLPRLCYTPNDPSLSTQYTITKIQAEAAWGVNTTTARGDTNVVIGITDTGVEPNHPDLKNNIKHNYSDIAGGGDTDSDGYIDNYSGWDLGENDNNPTYNTSQHGVHVSGIAAASVDNAIGVAGIGFKCKFLPIKITDAAGALTKSYEGITYAADHGCAVINCSWGGPTASQLGQDVVNYATINKNALVIAAAGNNGLDELFYPAAYKYVISVANTKSDDRRSSTSNFHYSVDVCAPGESINSTYPTNSYSSQTGTSMSAPCVAGAAAIVKSFYPAYTALQIGERLKTTCDNIYPLMAPNVLNKLGNGRINLFKALTQTLSPSVLMTQQNYTDNNDNTFVINDTLRLSGDFTNYLGATSNLTATLSTTSPYVSIQDASTTLGAVPTLGVVNNNSDPYQIKILSSAPQNQAVLFKLTYSDPSTSYTASEFFYVTVNVDYINVAINDVATSIASNGRIGYSQINQGGGLGFNYMDNGTLLYEAGLMIGINSNQVSDGVRGVSITDADFQSVSAAKNIVPAVFSEFDVDGTFRDATSVSPLPVTVHHKAFAWSTVGNRKYVIVQYTISNTGNYPLTNLYAGIFADWDIDVATYGSNRASFDAATKMGYAYYSGSAGTYAGVKLLTSSAPVVHYAIDNIAGGAGGADILGGDYSTAEKYLTLSTNRANAGVSGAGGDVIDIVSTGPYTIAAGDSVKVAFALIAGDNLADIKTSAQNAQIKYDGLNMTTVITNGSIGAANGMAVYPNPAHDRSTIDITLAEEERVELKIVNLLGEEIKVITSEKLQAGPHRFVYDTSMLASGLYYYQLTIGTKKMVQKLMVTRN
ncbi:MAG: S8/S53 family peptidase [Bacteroidota bacterium]